MVRLVRCSGDRPRPSEQSPSALLHALIDTSRRLTSTDLPPHGHDGLAWRCRLLLEDDGRFDTREAHRSDGLDKGIYDRWTGCASASPWASLRRRRPRHHLGGDDKIGKTRDALEPRAAAANFSGDRPDQLVICASHSLSFNHLCLVCFPFAARFSLSAATHSLAASPAGWISRKGRPHWLRDQHGTLVRRRPGQGGANDGRPAAPSAGRARTAGTAA